MKEQEIRRSDPPRGNRNRYLGIRRFMRVYGLSEEQAAARYDRPKGICEVCGADASGPRAILCTPCSNERERARAREAFRLKQAAKPPRVAKPRHKQTEMVISFGPPSPPAEKIITPEGMTITRIPGRRGLRNFFGDEKGETWTAAD